MIRGEVTTVRRAFLTAWICCASTRPLAGQETKPPDVAATVEVTVLTLDVLVTDGKDRPILDVRREEVEVKAGGLVQKIESFEPPRAGRSALAPEPSAAPAQEPTRSNLLLYFDREGLSRSALERSSKGASEAIGTLPGSTRIGVISYFIGPGRLAWDETAPQVIESAVQQLSESLPGTDDPTAEASAYSGPGSMGRSAGEPVRVWEHRQFRERALVEAVVRAPVGTGGFQTITERQNAERDFYAYLATEIQRQRQALEELRRTCELFAQLPGKHHLVLVSEGIERSPGTNVLRYLSSALRGGSSGLPPPAPFQTQLRAGSSAPFDDFERWLASSGVSFHVVNPERRTDGGTAEDSSLALVRNGSADSAALEDAPRRLAERTGGIVRSTAAGLDTILTAATSTYRISVRLQGVDTRKPYGVAVKVKRSGVTARHQSTFAKPTAQPPPAAVEIEAAREEASRSRRDERRPGAARYAKPPLPVRIVWKGRVRDDEKSPGHVMYRVELVLPYSELKFQTAEDALISTVRLSLKASGVRGTDGGDEMSVEMNPTFTGAEYSAAQSQDLVRPMMLSLVPGKYTLEAAASDLLDDRQGLAKAEVVAD